MITLASGHTNSTARTDGVQSGAGGRTLGLGSGAVSIGFRRKADGDCLFVTRSGGLVIVECKLWRNPQARREAVASILDYAKEIEAWDYADLRREVWSVPTA